jgi:hypothetical protein
VEGFVVSVLAEYFKSTPGMNAQDAYNADIKVASFYRILQIIIMLEMFVLATPVFVLAFSLRRNRAILHRGPPEPLTPRPWTVLAHAVLLAPWDCSRFVWKALVAGPDAEEPRAPADQCSSGSAIDVVISPSVFNAVPKMQPTPVGPPAPRSPSTPTSCTGKGLLRIQSVHSKGDPADELPPPALSPVMLILPIATNVNSDTP